jgi:folate-binding protein YgfZ
MPIPLILHGKHSRSPIAYEPFGPWIVPWRFASFDEEYRALRAGAGLIDYSVLAAIEAQGQDRAAFLQNLLSNDVKRLAVGGGCQAALLTPEAKLIALLVVLADPASLWLLCPVERAATVAQTLERHLFSEAVNITNHERREAVLALQGPRALDVLGRVSGTPIGLARDGDHVRSTLGRMPVRLIRHDLMDEPGALCLVDAAQADALWGWLCDQDGLQPVGWEALNAARIEAGRPWFGVDMDGDTLLPETGLEAIAASGTKGCYVGQEIVARIETYGSVNKKLVGLLVEGDDVPQPGDAVVHGGEPVGRITSACRSPRLRRPIALGYVKRSAYAIGTALEIVRGERRLAATVSARPIVEPAA